MMRFLVSVFFTILLLTFLIPHGAWGAEILYEELVTISSDEFSVGWQTSAPLPSVIYYGESPDSMARRVANDSATEHHYLLVQDLEPDTDYYYSVMVNGQPDENEWPLSPGVVHTLAKPPGDFLFSFATINDTHIGENVAGLIVVGGIELTPGFTWDDPFNPYWNFTNRQAVQQINEANVNFVFHKGDVTAGASYEQFLDAADIFGELEAPIYYARGNHDRVQHAEDYFMEVLGIESTHYSFDHQGIRFIVMDSNDEKGSGDVSDLQIPWLAEQVEGAYFNNLKVMIIAHHTFARHGAPFWAVDPADAEAVHEILVEYENFAGMFAGHSHRAKVLYDDDLGLAPFVETSASKEYPMGYSIVRVYDGGFSHSFYRTTCAECLEWASITRGEYFGLAPAVLMGQAEDRNFTYLYPDWTEPDDEDDTSDDDEASDDETSDDDPVPSSNPIDDDDVDDGCCG